MNLQDTVYGTLIETFSYPQLVKAFYLPYRQTQLTFLKLPPAGTEPQLAMTDPHSG